MAIETQTRIIDGRSVESTTIPATKSFPLKVKLVKIVGPAIAELLPELQKLIKNSGSKELKLDIGMLLQNNLNFESLQKVIELLLTNLDENTIKLVREILCCTFVDKRCVGEEANFDAVFTGEDVLLFKVIAFSLEVNFNKLFGKGSITKA